MDDDNHSNKGGYHSGSADYFLLAEQTNGVEGDTKPFVVELRRQVPTLKHWALRACRKFRLRNGLEWQRSQMPETLAEELEPGSDAAIPLCEVQFLKS